jgi:dimethylargininase
MLPAPNHALVRRFPPTYSSFYRQKGIDLDPSLALEQHRAYARALGECGLAVDQLPADEAFYDCVFVEDTAVVWRSTVLVTSIAEHREGEQAAVKAHFAGTHDIVEMPSGARLEGGDVLHSDDVTYVGLSSRTNQSGADALAKFMERAGRPVVPVEVVNALHLKTAVTYLGNGTVIAAPGCVDLDRFTNVAVIHTSPGEDGAANCLRINDSLLIPSGYPFSELALKAFADANGIQTRVLDISEFEKGGGSLSCLSLLWHEP